jgi:predicted Na+-dependent transporter
MRQALGFGNVFALAAFAALLWPLVAGLAVQNVVATIVMYGLAMLLDVALISLWLVLAVRYSRRAAAGALFAVPWLARMKGTGFPR